MQQVKFSQAQTRFIFFLILGPLWLLLGCSTIKIINLSDVSVRVRITVPDSQKAYVRTIESGDTVEVFSNYGGSYSVATLPNEEYLDLLESVRDQILERLFEEGATLSAADVAELTQRINNIELAIEELPNEQDSCRGSVPDYESAAVTVVWSTSENKWVVTC